MEEVNGMKQIRITLLAYIGLVFRKIRRSIDRMGAALSKRKPFVLKVTVNMPVILAWIFEVVTLTVAVWCAWLMFFAANILEVFTLGSRVFLLLAFAMMSSHYTSMNSGANSPPSKENRKGGAA